MLRTKVNTQQQTYLLVGAPNVGKSTFFNHLTNQTAEVSNFDRSTVSMKVGQLKRSKTTSIIDLPGIYQLAADNQDDRIVTNTLFFNSFDGILNLVNINSMQRDLHLTIQLLEYGLQPVSIALNMVDEARQWKVDYQKLSRALRAPVTPTSGKKNQNLKLAVDQLKCPVRNFKLDYGTEIEGYIQRIVDSLAVTGMSKRFLAIQLLEQNEIAEQFIRHNDENYAQTKQLVVDILGAKANRDYQQQVFEVRQQFINNLIASCVLRNQNFEQMLTHQQRRIDYVLLNRVFGVPIFLVVLVAIYYITFGPYTGGYLNDRIGYWLQDYLLQSVVIPKMMATSCPHFLTDILCNGLLNGIFSILPFMPYILILFFFVGLLQQSGYLARVSVILDQLLSGVGLSGRSVLNLISGMGCNVPAIMMARSLKSKKEKMTSIFITPFISCSARATVIAFVSSMIFTINSWIIILLFQIASGVVALLIGLIFSKTMFRRQANLFLIEVPKWRHPDFTTIAKLMWLETKTFMIRVGKFIVLGSIIIWLLSHLGPTGYVVNDSIRYSFIGYLGLWISYLLWPIGLFDWRITSCLMLSFPAKELAISNMSVLFGTDSAIQHYFNWKNGLSFLTFYTLYLPCLSTMAVMKKETRWKFTLINSGCSLLIAYIFAAIVYWITYSIV